MPKRAKKILNKIRDMSFTWGAETRIFGNCEFLCRNEWIPNCPIAICNSHALSGNQTLGHIENKLDLVFSLVVLLQRWLRKRKAKIKIIYIGRI